MCVRVMAVFTCSVEFKGVESSFCRYMYTGSQNVRNRTMLKPLDQNQVGRFYASASKYRGYVNRGVA